MGLSKRPCPMLTSHTTFCRNSVHISSYGAGYVSIGVCGGRRWGGAMGG